MRRLTVMSLLALAAACSKPDAKPAQDTTAQAPAGPMAFVTVVYNLPKDAAAFEKYYWDNHVPLVGSKQSEVGFIQAELTKFDATLDGKAPTHYRQAVLWFHNMADLQKGVATAGFKAIGDDLANFASGGLTAMVGEQTNDAAALTGDSTTFVTVIYQHPKDAAAFEAYYSATHIPLVGQHAAGHRLHPGRADEVLVQPRRLTRHVLPAGQALLPLPGRTQGRYRYRGLQGGGRRSGELRRRRAGGPGGACDGEPIAFGVRLSAIGCGPGGSSFT